MGKEYTNGQMDNPTQGSFITIKCMGLVLLIMVMEMNIEGTTDLIKKREKEHTNTQMG